jgi:hypothetical protein
MVVAYFKVTALYFFGGTEKNTELETGKLALWPRIETGNTKRQCNIRH